MHLRFPMPNETLTLTLLVSAAPGRRTRKSHAVPRWPFRAAAAVTAALIIAGCASLSGNRAPMTSAVVVNSPQEITQTALRKLLQADNSGREDQSRPVNRLLAFYEARKFQATWTGSASGEHMAVKLRAALAQAHEQGLRDDDYKLPPEAHPAPGAEAAQYDIALTGAALRYARDVHMGRVLPIEVYSDAEFPATQDDIAAGLAAAAGNGQISSYFDGLPPAHPEYRRLAKALMRYSAIADAGGWPIFSEKKFS